MKNAAVKRISAVMLSVLMIFVFSANAFAETIQDRLEQQLDDLANQYENADPETQESMQDKFSSLLEGAGLGNIDLGSLGGSDLGAVVGGLGDNLALDGVMGIIGDTFSSGMDMVQDALGGGLGTSDGSNTATTTKPATTAGSPNVIVPVTKPQGTTNAVGIPSTEVPSSAITNISANLPTTTVATTTAPVTYVPETTTAANIVGAGVTTAPQVDLDGVTDSGTDSSSMAVLIVMSISTLVIITAIIVFFVLKRK